MSRYPLYLFALAALCTVYGSVAPSTATQLVHHVSRDTLRLATRQYDSIYIYQERQQERTHDTLYLRDVSIEYRYRLLRDTVYCTRHDTVPYEVTVVRTKEIARPLTWFDHLTRLTFWVLLLLLSHRAVSLIRRLRKNQL